MPRTFRFAPSPNGRLHLGHAYSALCNEFYARQTQGRLLLRMEDIDPSRCKPEYEADIEADLAWLGIVLDGAVRRQSEHVATYAAVLQRLQSDGLIYPCFCTRGQIQRNGDGARDPDGAPLHRGRCRAISPEATRARLAAGEIPALRLDVDAALQGVDNALFWREFGEGEAERHVAAAPLDWGDVVLRGKERAAAYHLAVVVDDAEQGVTDVVRGRDLFAATSIHVLLQARLNLPTPRYRHHRLVIDASGAKMSKSASSRPLAALREEGYSAADLRGALGFAAVGAARPALGACAIN